jgi:hypothetical protein
MDERPDLAAAIASVQAMAARLPPCDLSARLHALVSRVEGGDQPGKQLATSANELADAAAAALDDDPWVQFALAARRLRDVASVEPSCAT